MNKFKLQKQELTEQKVKIAKAKERLSKMEDKYKNINYRYDKDIQRISEIMYKAEKEVLESLDLYKPNHCHYEDPVRPVYNNSYKIRSITDTLLSLRVSYYMGEGDYWSYSLKIPIVYFDMSDEEIMKAHKKWSLERMTKKQEKKNEQELLKKKELFNTLKKELGV